MLKLRFPPFSKLITYYKYKIMHQIEIIFKGNLAHKSIGIYFL